MNAKRSPLESKTQCRILSHLNSLPRFWAVKHPATFRRGVPDIVCCYRGQFIGLEVKRSGQKPAELQAATLELIRAAAGRAEVVHNIDDVHEILLGVDEQLAVQRFGE
jgi:hypothetical protein